jgi:hypothetical protein
MTTDPFESFKKRKSEDDKLDRKNLPAENVGKVSNYFEVPNEISNDQVVQEPSETPAPAQTPNAEQAAPKPSNSAVKRLEALTQLLIRKGVITDDELRMMSDLLDR